MSHAAAAFLLTLPALTSIINPIGAALIFAQVAHGRADQARIVRRVALYSLLVMLFALWAGSYVLTFFGITLAALRIAGGAIIAQRAWTLLSAPERHEARKATEVQAATDEDDIAFYPLTMPFTTGPGTIAVTIAIGAGRPAGAGIVDFFAGASLACVVMAGIIYVTYRSADRLVSALGPHGASVLTRTIAFLLLCIGTQIAINGLIQAAEPLLKG